MENEFEKRITELGNEVIKLLEGERKDVENRYQTLLSSGEEIKARDIKRFARQLDYFDKTKNLAEKTIKYSMESYNIGRERFIISLE